MLDFFELLRKQFPFEQKLYIVLDNHPSHHTKLVTERADILNFHLMFMPPYSPELNSIESLWSVIKRSVKHQMVLRKLVNVTQL